MDSGDIQSIRRALAGNPSGFEGLHAAHAGWVTAYLLRCGFAPQDAEDLAQETFIRAFRSLGTFDGAKGTFRGWLAAIVRNVARRHWARRPTENHFDPDLAAETLRDPADVVGGAEAREETAALDECISRLPENLGELVRLRYVWAMTTRGIAEATGLAESTVRLRLDEAKGRLLGCLKSKGFME